MNTSPKLANRKSLPSEEAYSLSNLIGPVPGLKILPDPNDDEYCKVVRRVLHELQVQAAEKDQLGLAEVMSRCLAEIDRMTLPPVIDNIRYQIGVTVIGLATPGNESDD